MPDSEILEPVTEARSPGAGFAVREPVPGDAAAVRDVMRDAWLAAVAARPARKGAPSVADVRETFRDEAALEAWLSASFAPRIGSLVQRVAERTSGVVGFLRIARHASGDELRMAFVRPEFQGAGAGYAMFRDAASALWTAGSRPLWADFPAYDARTQAVLGRWGFDLKTLAVAPGFHHSFPSAKISALRLTWDPNSAAHA